MSCWQKEVFLFLIDEPVVLDDIFTIIFSFFINDSLAWPHSTIIQHFIDIKRIILKCFRWKNIALLLHELAKAIFLTSFWENFLESFWNLDCGNWINILRICVNFFNFISGICIVNYPILILVMFKFSNMPCLLQTPSTFCFRRSRLSIYQSINMNIGLNLRVSILGFWHLISLLLVRFHGIVFIVEDLLYIFRVTA